LGIRPSLDTIWKIGEADDALLSALRLRRIGSSVALLAVK
jgi:ribosomal protein L30/L7E